MLTINSDRTHSIPDLAARLTDRALELLGGAGVLGDSVEMELELWHTLTAELKRELRERRFDQGRDEASLDGALKQIVRRAARQVARETSRFSAYRAHRAERATGRFFRV